MTIPHREPPTRPRWSTIAIGGHDCEMFVPPDPRPGRAIIFLHGIRGRWLREMPVLRDLLEAERVPVLGPRAGRSWWLDRIVPGFDAAVSPEQFVVGGVRAEVERRFGVTPPGIALVGTGMGGQGALRISYRHPAAFPVAAAILHVHPLNWPRHQCFASDPDDVHWHDGAVRLHSKLVALGIPHLALLEPRGGGHTLEYHDRVAPEVMRFVLDALDAESRRIA